MARLNLNDPPTAWYLSKRRIVVVGSLPVAVFTVWAIYHALAVVKALTGHGNVLALTWTVTFLLMWWVPLSWFELPHRGARHSAARRRGPREHLVTAVQIPVYNEDPATLQACLLSLLNQTRIPDRVHVVDDGSTSPEDYEPVRAWWEAQARLAGIEQTWTRTVNRGKRHAQMEVLADDPADIFITLDSDSVLDSKAIAEGLKPFADHRVMSVAGMVVVWNMRTNWLTLLTCMLYTPFTRGFRSAQSLLGRVMVNSGTLAFYRGEVVRYYAGSYEHEDFRGRPMQMNDDSMLTFYGMLHGRTVHQPSSVAFTIVPEKFTHYRKQQMRWMRGTFVRSFWWFRYLSPKDPAWWMPFTEIAQIFLSIAVMAAVVVIRPPTTSLWQLAQVTALVGAGLNYLTALRYFSIRRSDEPLWLQTLVFALAPVAGVWRFVILRPMVLWAMVTCWRIQSWGTRGSVEVALDAA